MSIYANIPLVVKGEVLPNYVICKKCNHAYITSDFSLWNNVM